MKKTILILGVTLSIAFTSCELPDQMDTGELYYNADTSEVPNNKDIREIFFIIGSGQKFTYSDFELYDSSTHILYFKTEQDYFKNIYSNTFAFVDNGEIIYQGSFVPGYSSYIPIGPFIMSPPMYGNYALRIDDWHHIKPDVRSSPRIISIFKEHNLLHSGLSGEINLIDIIGTQLVFKFTITNHDESDLLILDINKTGPPLFHYFTNGLYIRDLKHNEIYSSNIIHQSPVPWNSWQTEWMSQIKSGESIQFTINDTLATPIIPGEYFASFEFPGLLHVAKDQLYQNSNRVWLGDIQLTKKITIY